MAASSEGRRWHPWAAVVETSTASVFFAGDLAFKLKKPLDFGYADFRSMALRHQACLDEVRLNSRLAPDVYLGVGDIRSPEGQVLDHVVLMRRMPAERRLTALLGQPGEAESSLLSVAREIAAFHASTRVVDSVDSLGTQTGVCRLWQDSVAGLDAVATEFIPESTRRAIADLGQTFIAGRRPLFEQRRGDGLMRDGHGDLLADDIFLLDDGPRILDCLEFDERLRLGDVWLDVAFLAMDLERLGFPKLATVFLDAYREFSGTDAPSSLLHFFVAYRAHIRAKVAAIRAVQGRPASAREARTLAAMCLRHLKLGAVTLTIVGGLPGSGKTTLATGLAEQLGALHLSSDVVRHELSGLNPPPTSGYQSGAYTPEMTRATYAELLRRAEVALALGQSVVLDATWRDASIRERARAVAVRAHTPLTELRCVVDEETARRWLDARRGGPSDATVATRQAMAAVVDPWPGSQRVNVTSEDAVAVAMAAVRRSAMRRGPTALAAARS